MLLSTDALTLIIGSLTESVVVPADEEGAAASTAAGGVVVAMGEMDGHDGARVLCGTSITPNAIAANAIAPNAIEFARV